jgi:hypothetical protein
MTLYEYLARLESDNGWEETRRILIGLCNEYKPKEDGLLVDYITSQLATRDIEENNNQSELWRYWK